ncbi:MAG: DUF1822 family protein [Cyanobacteriota bacterium]|nr:DUF1822 family protein [Cyanobacteriota bacterium]
MTFLFAEPTQTWLEISPAVQTRAWEKSQQVSHPVSRWQTYLDRLCLETVLSELQGEFATEVTFPETSSPWGIVAGSSLTLGGRRIVLVVTETIDEDELRVPQEWVDIPDWVADYYLAVRVDIEEGYLAIWGYTTHAQLKAQGECDTFDRTYSLEGDRLIGDTNVLWVTAQLDVEERTRATVDPLPELPQVQARNLLRRLGDPELAAPRLEVPFAMWGALLQQEDWRHQLVQQRQGEAIVEASNWFGGAFDAAWQSIESLFPASENLAFRFRRLAVGEARPVRRVKQLELGNASVAVFVEMSPEADDRIGIRVQLHPSPGCTHLPANLSLALCSQTGTPLKEIQSRDRDNFIQLPRFKCASGSYFAVRVTLEDTSAIEHFYI